MPRSTTHVKPPTISEVWQSDVWKVDDDWKEVDSKEEKKRRQNRINQRAYRRRNPANGKSTKPTKQRPFRVERFRIPASEVVQKQSHRAVISETSQPAVTESGTEINTENVGSDVAEALQVLTSPDDILNFVPISNTSGIDSWLGTIGLKKSSQKAEGSLDTTTISSTHTSLEPWIKDAFSNFRPQIPCETEQFLSRDSDGQTLFRISMAQLISPYSPENKIASSFKSPINPNGFPLSSDHLLRLIHFNVFRGLITNKSILSGRTLQTRIHLDIALPESRNLCDGLALIRSKPGEVIPDSLSPTYVQASIAHSSWFNMFPFPAIRDNLIKAEQDFNHEDLCFDLFGEMFFNSALASTSNEVWFVEDEYEDDVTAKRKGLILWGEPWDMDAWEVTPGFVKKWAWVLNNCPEMIDSTNRWRSKRDEKPLSYSSATVSEQW